MHFIRFFWLILCCITLPISALILTSKNILDINQYIDYAAGSQQCVFLDIDNTIAKNEHDVGTDHWVELQIHEKMSEGLSREEAWKLIRPFYVNLQLSLSLLPVEDTTASLIEKLQKAGIPVIGLTLRGDPVIDRTIEQLRNINIDFSKSFMSPQYDIELGSIKKRCLYKKGIIFCDLNHKGSMMVEFLKQIKYKPKKIIFVDDKMRNVINVEEAAKKLGIECIAIHYIYLADSNKTFDPELTEPDFSIASSHA